MSEELARIEEQEETAIMPVTAELIDLRDVQAVAEALRRAREIERELWRFRASVLEPVVRAACERQGTKTLHVGALTVTLSGGSKTTWDGERLASELAHAGMPVELIAEIVYPEWKVDARRAERAARANPDYARVIDGARTTEPDRYRVSVK